MHCINKKVVVGLVVVGVAVAVAWPQVLPAALPLLVLAICPLSMLVMMRGMSGQGQCAAGEKGDVAADLTKLRAELDQLRAQRGLSSVQVAAPPIGHER